MDIDQTLQEAIRHQQRGERQNAEKLYRTILVKESRHSDANHNLGIILKQGGQLESALEFFKIALEINPNQGQFWVSYIDCLIHLKQFSAAGTILKQGQSRGLKGSVVDQLLLRLKSTQDDRVGLPQAKIDSLITLYSDGQIQAVLNAIEILITNYPAEAILYNISGACYASLAQFDVAVNNYMKAIEINSDYADAHNNLGNTLKDQGKLNAAIKSYERALSINPDYAEAYNNLGVVLKMSDKLSFAVESYERALSINPNYAEAYNNLGIALKNLGELSNAVTSYEKALEINPNYAEAYSNLGLTQFKIGQFTNAVKNYEKALEINPNYAEAYSNLGLVQVELGQFSNAVKSYEMALKLKPNFAEGYCNYALLLYEYGKFDAALKYCKCALELKPNLTRAWTNLFYLIKALEPQYSSRQRVRYLLNDKLSEDVLNSVDFVILNYSLNAFRPHCVEDSFSYVINALPLITDEEINNPDTQCFLNESSFFPDKVIALIHFGRSGTGLLHSLIDNHPEISTLPSIYFSEYYNAEVWGKLTAQGWGQLPENFIKQFAVLFDARSSTPVPSIDKPIANLGKEEGMANVGERRNEVLMVDKDAFSVELKKSMSGYSKLGVKLFFDLVHSAYEKTLNKSSSKHTLFYHIHNPSTYAKLNFLRYNPDARLIMMVREPVKSCESWLRNVFNLNKISQVHYRIINMLFDIDQVAFRYQDAIGVRLEDLKKHPKETVTALCDWMGIEEEASLFEMTAQGKKWWGDPSSPAYSTEGMSPFDDSAITRKIGNKVFSEQDQFILRTLFYPFRVQFKYVEENLIGFKEDLKIIKPLLDQPFGFQETLAENLNQDLEAMMRSGSALYFRAALHDRWEVLNEFNDYPHMLKPLTISVKK
jgi:tetratricopeptide (TPR) repeat protein